MRRYWSEIPLVIDQEVELSRELHHHICDVCRLTVGAKFELLTAQQKAFLVELTIVSKKSSMVRVLEQRDIPALKSPYIRLCLSIPKFSTFESLLEKSVELGIHRVQ
ncbi:MAG: 16S rRNA (uracil(1498)-N(3))-methyltransferase, partial [Bdellovibrionales bacterium]|nr:16S rRNA (uracil(1498)-N(3))-methyltransferase [Bdellovibrionales bacterium]